MSPWDVPGNVEKLKRYWAEGWSAAQIAGRILGDSTKRSAVIGKAHRLGLADRKNHRRTHSGPRPANQRPQFHFARTDRPRGAANAAGPASSPAGGTGPLHPSKHTFIVRKPRRNNPARPNDKAQFFDFHFRNMPKPSDGVVDLASDPGDPPIKQRVSLLDLERHHCRAPLGSPVMFCGRPKTHGSYCHAHASRFWTPEAMRMRKHKITPPSGTPQGEPGHPTRNESADADGRRAAETQVQVRGQISASPAIHQQEQANG